MMSGKARERGFFSGGGPDSRGSRGAPPPPPGAARSPTSGDGSTDRLCAPPVADGGEKRKSDVISPPLPLDRVLLLLLLFIIFIVLLESRVPGKKLGMFNLIALGDLIDSFIPDIKRHIFPNVRKQAKVFCDRWQAANTLVYSSALQKFGVHAYIPASLVQKREFARNIPAEYSASDLSTRLDPDMLSSVLSIRRRTLVDGSASDRVEFVFSTVNILRRLSLASVAFDVTPVIPPPKRCFCCQRFRHISEQYRSTHPTCEYFFQEHPFRDCPNTRLTPRCANCGDRHPAYSRDCTIYMFEFSVMKKRTLKNCGYEEAENLLLSRGISKPLFSVESWRMGQDFPLDVGEGVSSIHSARDELSSANLVAEILLSMPPPPASASTLMVRNEEETGQ